ncbi:HWE histidine kinase domain-containing protein [Sphingomonas sp. ASV193]|uniref:sensor histidine kinase n=1 Tax=Sphingomonas sp. ASV193 TaxID=3144405 RepID=UPI0032E89AFE
MQIDFEALLAAAPNPYVLLDAGLRIAWMNDSYLQVTMRDRADIIGRQIFEAFPSDPASESYRLLSASLERVLRSGIADELALIRYDIPRGDGQMATRYWSATHTPLLNSSGRVEFILQHTVDVTELHSLRALRDATGVVERAGAVQARNFSLAEETHRLNALVEQAPGFVAVLAGPDHVFQMANASYRTLVGGRDVVGKPLAAALPEVIEQGFLALLDQVRSTRTAYIGRRQKVMLQNAAAGQSQERYLDFIYQPIVLDGEVSGVFVQGHDVSDQVEAEEHQKLLINELNHRVKNTLAIVQALAGQSFRQADSSGAGLATFSARLAALSAAHGLLTRGNWESASIEDVVRTSLEATAGTDSLRYSLSGPNLALPPQMTTSVAMLIHELSTNAIKYGALSRPEGTIAIDWGVEEIGGRRRLSLDWTEKGGPPVTPPTRRGFGTRLITRGIASDQNSDVRLKFEADGLRCRVLATLPEASL